MRPYTITEFILAVTVSSFISFYAGTLTIDRELEALQITKLKIDIIKLDRELNE